MAVGDEALKEIQASNPKEEVLERDLLWIKGKWDEIWKSGQVQNQNFVKIMQAKKESSEPVMQYWTRLSGLVAKCKLETMQTAEIENTLQVAGFTNGVGDTEMVKSIGEKKMTFVELDKLIKDNNEVKQILKQQQHNVQVKQEPIGQVRKRKDGKEHKKSKKSASVVEKNGQQNTWKIVLQ